LEGGDGQRSAQRRVGEGNVEPRDQVLPVALEARVLLHLDQHVQVARRRAGPAGVAAAGDPDPLPAVDAGRQVDRQGSGLLLVAAAPALPARSLRHAPVAVTAVARLRANDLTEHCPRHGLQLAGALAARARLDRGPGLGAVAVAVRARTGDLDLDFPLGAGQHLVQRHSHPNGDVGPALRTGRPAAEHRAQVAPAEERLEDVTDVSEAAEARLVAAGA